jgi:hypothetical protein
MTSNIFFNTQHSPIGAFASFTLGSKGAKGGLGLELGKPADQNVFIGIADENSISTDCLRLEMPSRQSNAPAAVFEVRIAAPQAGISSVKVRHPVSI